MRSAPRSAALVPLVLLILPALAAARPPSALPEGAHAFVGAHVIVAPGRAIEGGTVVIRDGLVESVSASSRVPPDARTWDATGMVIFPAFVDAHVPAARLAAAGAPAAPAGTLRAGAVHPNALVHPEVDVLEGLVLDPKAVAAFRKEGFGTALVVPDSGILRGRGAVLALGEGALGTLVLAGDAAMQAAFDTAPEGSDAAPGSVMGSTAILRQALLDASWHARARGVARGGDPGPEESAALSALEPLVATSRRPGDRVLHFECRDVLDALRAGRVADEFGLSLRLVGSGDEAVRLPELAALGAPVVLPVAFPDPPGAVSEEEWLDVPLAVLRHWDLAPDAPRFLSEAGIEVSLTAHRLTSVDAFRARVRRAIERGLGEDEALAMVTTRPADLLGLGHRLGTLDKGKLATFVIARGRPFQSGTEVREVWVAGRRFVVSTEPQGVEGRWKAVVSAEGRSVAGRLVIEGKGGSFSFKPDGAVGGEGGRATETAAVSKVAARHDGVRLELAGKAISRTAPVVLDLALRGASLAGRSDDGVAVEATRLVGPDPDDPPPEPEPRRELPPRRGPVSPGDDVLVQGVTAWTCGPAGVLEGVDVLVKGGRIAGVGVGLSAPEGVPVVDGRALHLTPGLVDAHSHAAIVGGVNEATSSCTAEVRIGDVVNSETPDIYRQLAGGLTTANLLHGSANCMGGQSQVIKLRWGASPEALKFEGATPGIKFALGENVKQSNWGEKHTTRFPQTRMGVEQFMRTKFLEALDHRDRWKAWSRSRRGLPPRPDLQLDALVEILEGRRSVHCHSYRQDEILMMMRVAEEMGFRVGTFQHVLEGYKVADELAAHGAMASCFSDWWGYKFEVQDAIPWDGALMHDRGVVVSFNSDSSELARRLNLEAAKAVKWGGLAPETALLFVTLNPARQLGVDDRIGSIEVGKDADLVLWTGPPLSPASRVERTWVDGRLYFSRAADEAGRPALEAEHAKLVERARSATEGGQRGGTEFRPAYWEKVMGCAENEHAVEDEEVMP